MSWAFLGGLVGFAIVATVVVLIVRKKIRQFSSDVFGKADILQALSEIDSMEDNRPRSLNGCDTLLLPQIIRDFPDFDVNLAKTYARDYIKQKLQGKSGLTIYNVVISKYLRSDIQRTIVFQMALSYMENGDRCQKRYELDYSHILSAQASSVAANCPNCGGALGYGVVNCPFCGSRVANVLGNSWKFTEIRER